MKKLLHIDTDLQIANRIHKNDSNEVSQITDKAQNIAFVQSDVAKMPVYNYNGYYEFDGQVNTRMVAYNLPLNFTIRKPIIHIKYTHVEDGNKFLFVARTDNLNRYEIGYYQSRLSLWYSSATAVLHDYVNFTLGQTYLISCIPYLDSGVERIALFLDGLSIVGNILPFSTVCTPNYISIGDYADLDLSTNKFNIHYVELFNDVQDLTLIEATEIATQKYNSNSFNYIRRYKDEGFKFYLSSTFLKDVNANASDQITSIKEEIEEIESNQITNGLKFTRGNLDINRSRNQFLLNAPYIDIINSWSVGYWHNYYEAYAAQPFPFWGNLICSLRYSGGKYVMAYSGVGQSEQIGTYVMDADKWYHLCWLFDGTTLYMLVDGVLRDIFTPTFTTADINSIDIGIGREYCYIDDMFLYDGLIVDPTGYSVGQKILQPPRRRCLDNTIKQYPIP